MLIRCGGQHDDDDTPRHSEFISGSLAVVSHALNLSNAISKFCQEMLKQVQHDVILLNIAEKVQECDATEAK